MSDKPTCILIGYWCGGTNKNTTLPDPRDFVDPKWDSCERDAVAAWLESGKCVAAWGGWADCRICACMNGGTDLSDGVYIWPSGLAHYLRDHAVRLPQVVVDRALAVGRVEPSAWVPDDFLFPESHVDVDIEWWQSLKSFRD